jgi:hypothetical protein
MSKTVGNIFRPEDIEKLFTIGEELRDDPYLHMMGRSRRIKEKPVAVPEEVITPLMSPKKEIIIPKPIQKKYERRIRHKNAWRRTFNVFLLVTGTIFMFVLTCISLMITTAIYQAIFN